MHRGVFTNAASTNGNCSYVALQWRSGISRGRCFVLAAGTTDTTCRLRRRHRVYGHSVGIYFCWARPHVSSIRLGD